VTERLYGNHEIQTPVSIKPVFELKFLMFRLTCNKNEFLKSASFIEKLNLSLNVGLHSPGSLV